MTFLFSGGINSLPSYSLEVEEFDLETLSWTARSPLPTNASEATFVHDGADLVLVNPSQNNLLRWNDTSFSFGIIYGLDTNQTLRHATVIPVKEEHFAPCKLHSKWSLYYASYLND